MKTIKRGDLVMLNGNLAAVVGIEGDHGIPEDHVALWYGSEPAETNQTPVAWTVPIEYCQLVEKLELKH